VGIVVTSDGSVTGLDRDEYAECEQRVIEELKSLGKPFVVLMNTENETSEASRSLCSAMESDYGVTVIPVNCLTMSKEDILEILAKLLYAFPVKEINVSMPKWVNSLEKGHWLKTELFDGIKKAAASVRLIRDISALANAISELGDVTGSAVSSIDLGSGVCKLSVSLDNQLFYRILSEETGLELSGEDELMPKILELVSFKKRFEKFSEALRQVEEIGYGIVMPAEDELTLDEPEIIRQGGKYGVRLKANAPSIHLIKADISAEVAPIVGTEKQSQELIDYLLNDFEDDPSKIWETNIFGKSLSELVSEGLHSKLYRLPDDAREKLREAVERIINEGCSGLICLLI
jgi:stage IV sporulation protein A